MSAWEDRVECTQIDRVHTYALGALRSDEMRVVEAHLATCADCRKEVERMRMIADNLHAWPTDVIKPTSSLWDRLVDRIRVDGSAESGNRSTWSEPDWKTVVPGVYCKLLATDVERNRVTMLVRLAPGGAYPPHRHAGDEALHLLHGELWIDDRKLHPGDYYRNQAGTTDLRVWSETGCTCVLFTSPQDVLLTGDAAE